MRKIICMLFVAITCSVLFLIHCSTSPENKFAQFDNDFFYKNVPEFPGARLLTKADIPENQQPFLT